MNRDNTSNKAESKATSLDESLPKSTDWHTLSQEEAMDRLETSKEGLSKDAVKKRRQVFGKNTFPTGTTVTLFGIFLRQFRNPLTFILIIAAIVSFWLGNINDGSFIVLVILSDITIGVIQEWRAETSAKALRKSIEVKARVLRNGEKEEVKGAELVPGDVVLLESGDAVPADTRLFKASQLRIDESLLTGESTSVTKDAQAQLDKDTSIGDRKNMVHAGTLVLAGRGRGVVCRTGHDSEIGRIAKSLGRQDEPPPLLNKLNAFAKNIALAILVLVSILGIGQYLRGETLIDIFFLAVALAVSAIPEGLPICITVALSSASNRMAKRNVIVRLLAAVEGLGSTTLIASDKTGTLTQNKLTVKKLTLPVQDEGITFGSVELEEDTFIRQNRDERDKKDNSGKSEEIDDQQLQKKIEDLMIASVLSNEGSLRKRDGELEAIGDTVDTAFLWAAHNFDITSDKLTEKYEPFGEIPYESARRYSASFNRRDGDAMAFVKGAPEEIVSMCKIGDNSGWEETVEEMADEGYRVLALASGRIEKEKADPEVLKDLTLLGFAGLIDPVREEVPDAIEKCRDAGIEVRMITGDHPLTGLAIARELNLASSKDEVMTGHELKQAMEGRKDLKDRIKQTKVFARVEPTQKTEIVDALSDLGHYVAVTGDGVNDAPALTAAHIGIAMGKAGTDVARGAADLILADDNFASIVGGVEEGRRAYDNIRKVTWLLLSLAVSEIILFFLAFLFALPLPLNAVQLLWLNLVTNGVQDVALAFERGEKGLLKRKPRTPDEPLFDKAMIWETFFSGFWIGIISFAYFYYVLVIQQVDTYQARNLLLLLMVLFSNIHIFNTRSEHISVFKIPFFSNPFLLITIAAAQGLHIVSMYIPGLRDVLYIQPVSFQNWGLSLLIATSIILVVEIDKYLRKSFITKK